MAQGYCSTNGSTSEVHGVIQSKNLKRKNFIIRSFTGEKYFVPINEVESIENKSLLVGGKVKFRNHTDVRKSYKLQRIGGAKIQKHLKKK